MLNLKPYWDKFSRGLYSRGSNVAIRKFHFSQGFIFANSKIRTSRGFNFSNFFIRESESPRKLILASIHPNKQDIFPGSNLARLKVIENKNISKIIAWSAQLSMIKCQFKSLKQVLGSKRDDGKSGGD